MAVRTQLRRNRSSSRFEQRRGILLELYMSRNRKIGICLQVLPLCVNRNIGMNWKIGDSEAEIRKEQRQRQTQELAVIPAIFLADRIKGSEYDPPPSLSITHSMIIHGL